MQAYSCYLEALRIQPTFAIAWSNLAGLFMESGDFNRALQYYKVWLTFIFTCLNELLLGAFFKSDRPISYDVFTSDILLSYY